jgi:hypothetical protein
VTRPRPGFALEAAIERAGKITSESEDPGFWVLVFAAQANEAVIRHFELRRAEAPDDPDRACRLALVWMAQVRGSTRKVFLRESAEGLLAETLEQHPDHAFARLLRAENLAGWPRRFGKGELARAELAKLDPPPPHAQTGPLDRATLQSRARQLVRRLDR